MKGGDKKERKLPTHIRKVILLIDEISKLFHRERERERERERNQEKRERKCELIISFQGGRWGFRKKSSDNCKFQNWVVMRNIAHSATLVEPCGDFDTKNDSIAQILKINSIDLRVYRLRLRGCKHETRKV